MTITLNEKLKAAGTEPANLGVSLPRGTESVEGISLRSLSPSGEFSHAVKAFPGYVTVLQEGEKEPLRNALLGKEGKLELRLGTQELHRSEILLVQSHDALLKEASVQDALRSAGAPDKDIRPLLEKLGLNDVAGKSPRDLGTAALKRLAIGCSMYAKARILLYDRPFAGSDPAWIERIAQLLLSVGEANARAMIVTGEASLPQAWKNNGRVILQDPKQNAGVLTMPGKPANGVAVSVRDLMQSGQVLSQASIITRPQAIYSQLATRSHEQMQTEAIQNPKSGLVDQNQLGGGAGASQLQVEGMQQAREPGEEQQSELGKRPKRLTSVNNIHRLQQVKAYRIVGEYMRKIRSRISARPAELDIPTAARLLEFTKRSELRMGTAIFILAVLAMCLIAYLNRL